ncbi:MAG TPA: hypothetical protein VMK32_06790 [Burkholderiaceae bacterium]|nr:hypothetical protein [Burkholderiaceae bacterium]
MSIKTGAARAPGKPARRAFCALLMVLVTLSGCAPHRPPGAAPAAEAAQPPPPLPPVPWREDVAASLVNGNAQWADPGRDRTIEGRWTAPADGGRVLIVVLPGLAQGSRIPTALAETLAHAGFAVLALGHPGNDETIWQGPEARRADFELAARRVYATREVAERVADVRFVLAALERQPPSWLRGAPSRVGLLGIGPGAQTAQWLVGEWMARDVPPAADPRIGAAALIGPYVGFEGPALYQRYGAITTPLLLAYGLGETDPYGLGMTAQQRRAMSNQLANARVIELRLPASTVAALQLPGMPQGADAASMGRMPQNASIAREPQNRSGRGSGGGGPSAGGGPGGPSEAMMSPSAGAPSMARNVQAARVAVLFSISAFFEAELLNSADARDWLEGPHPGPAQWSTLPAGRAVAAQPR